MAFSKITLNNDTLMDVTQDTVASSNLLSGETATGADGETVEGAIEIKQTGPTVVPTFNTSTGNIHIEATIESGYYDSNKTTTGNYTPAAIGIPTQGSKTVTPSESAQSAVTAGKYTTGEVTVGAISSTYVGSGITQRNADDMTASGASVTAPAGYYAEASSKAIATATQATPSVTINSSTGLVTATSAQAAGYVSGGTKTGTLQLSAQGAKTVTPSESSQTAVAAGKYTTGAVTVGAVSSTYVGSGIAKRSATDITADGAVVSVPAGYYASNGSKSVGTTTHPDPTVSINNSTGLITASHTQGTGYVTGSTTTDTLQLSTQAATTITPTKSSQTAVEAGKYTTGAVTVGAYTLSLQEKTVTPTGYIQIIEADGPESITTGDFLKSGAPIYNSPSTTGYYSISIDLSSIISGESYHVTGSGHYESYGMTNYTYTIDSDWVAGEPIPLVFSPTTSNFLSLTWNSSGLVATFPTVHSQQDENIEFSGNLTFTAKEGGYDGLSSVTVEAIPSQYIIPAGTKTITENGTGIDVAQYANADVNISSSSISVSPLSVTTNGTYTAPTGTAYSPVTVNVSGGGGTTPASPKDVNFIDYDGTILYSYTKAEFAQLTALPANPDHSGDDIPLTSQGWNWTLAQINAQLTAQPNDPVTVGQMYVTTDGKTYIEIELYEWRLSPYLGIAVNGTVVVDWGDNTATSTVTDTSLTTQIRTFHEYAAAGRYKISISVSSGSFAFYGTAKYTLLNKNSSTGNQNRVYSNAVQSVRIGNNASIGNYAFNTCYSLASITIPSGVTSIGSSAFNTCYSLASITIPSGVTSIDSSAFNTCYSLASITIPSGVTSIDSSAFYYCYSLASITIPSGVTSIGSYAFYCCYSLASITIPSGVTSIGNYAFGYCYSLASITIPSGVTSIDSNAFGYCYGLAKLRFLPITPPTVANSDAFTGIPTDCVISVPTGSLSAYTGATNYPSSSTYTYIEE